MDLLAENICSCWENGADQLLLQKLSGLFLFYGYLPGAAPDWGGLGRRPCC
jgi:hypothetical protein